MKWHGSRNDFAMAFLAGFRYAHDIMHQTGEEVDAGGSLSRTKGGVIERSVQ